MTDAFPPNAWSRQDANQVVESMQSTAYQAGLDAGTARTASTTRLDQLRETVQMMRDGADREYRTMLNPDGSESQFAPEHRHFRDAFDAVLRLMGEASDG